MGFNPYDYYITPEEYELAATNGLTRKHVNDRIRKHGWGKQKALAIPPTFAVRISKEIRMLAKQHSIAADVFHSRLKIGWDEKRAAITPIRDAVWKRENARRAYESARKIPREMVELASSNGISYQTFWHRVRRAKVKWDIFEAATTPVSPLNCIKRLKTLYGEEFFQKQREWLFFKQ